MNVVSLVPRPAPGYEARMWLVYNKGMQVM